MTDIPRKTEGTVKSIPTAAHLREAALLISKPGQWTRNTAARDKSNISIDPRSADAVRWCAFGAIIGVMGNLYESDSLIYERLWELDSHRSTLVTINDVFGRSAAIDELNRLADLAESLETKSC